METDTFWSRKWLRIRWPIRWLHTYWGREKIVYIYADASKAIKAMERMRWQLIKMRDDLAPKLEDGPL